MLLSQAVLLLSFALILAILLKLFRKCFVFLLKSLDTLRISRATSCLIMFALSGAMVSITLALVAFCGALLMWEGSLLTTLLSAWAAVCSNNVIVTP